MKVFSIVNLFAVQALVQAVTIDTAGETEFFSNLKWPKIDIPKIDIPKIDPPKIDIPKPNIPTINIPSIDDLISQFKGDRTWHGKTWKYYDQQ